MNFCCVLFQVAATELVNGTVPFQLDLKQYS